MLNKKGQVSTEYLVILAVVLVIALVVVYLVSSQSSGAATILETGSKSYWESSSPLAVTEYTATGTSLTLTVKNMDPQKLTVTSITGTGFNEYTTNTTFNVGQEQLVTLTLSSTCGVAGTPYEYGDVTIKYAKGISTNLVQPGDKPFVGRCA
ncbi:MAG: class III signal peptide-containing protein [Candidatus Micrarchaeota archaeon]